MENVTYRDARLDDAEQLARVARDTFVDTFGRLYRSEDLQAFLAKTRSLDATMRYLADPATRHHLALEGDKIIGFADLGEFKLPYDPGQRRPTELHRLYLAAVAKGKGVADRLMEWTIAEARTLGADDLYLGVWSANERAQRFYRRHGFEIVGEYLFPVGEQMDEEYIMRRAV
jgi:ribosomal protein S18 acetylase RimI-like enzyme